MKVRGQPVGTEAVIALHPLNCWQTSRTRATADLPGVMGMSVLQEETLSR